MDLDEKDIKDKDNNELGHCGFWDEEVSKSDYCVEFKIRDDPLFESMK